MKELRMQFLDDVSVRQRGITAVLNSPWGSMGLRCLGAGEGRASAVWVRLEQGARRALGLFPRLWTLLPSGRAPSSPGCTDGVGGLGLTFCLLNYTREK